MFRITVMRVSTDSTVMDVDVLAYADISRFCRASRCASYLVRVFDHKGELEVTACIESIPLVGPTLWEVVARSVATAVMGAEHVPPRLERQVAAL